MLKFCNLLRKNLEFRHCRPQIRLSVMKINPKKTWIKHEKFHLVFLSFSFKRGRKKAKVKVFCFCDALWSLGDDNSFYPFRLKCQYDNSLQVENVHFFLTFSIVARHLITGYPTFIFHMLSWVSVFCSLNFITKAVWVPIGKLLLDGNLLFTLLRGSNYSI